MSPLDRAFAEWYADRDPVTADSWWNGDHECDVTCDCEDAIYIEARATAIANDSLVIDESTERENA